VWFCRIRRLAHDGSRSVTNEEARSEKGTTRKKSVTSRSIWKTARGLREGTTSTDGNFPNPFSARCRIKKPHSLIPERRFLSTSNLGSFVRQWIHLADAIPIFQICGVEPLHVPAGPAEPPSYPTALSVRTNVHSISHITFKASIKLFSSHGHDISNHNRPRESFIPGRAAGR
jgi:hypothetical protein